MIKYSLYDNKWITGEYQPRVVAYYFREWENYHMEFHCHDQVEIMYVITGKCTVDTRDNSFSLTKGDLILLDAGIVHRLIVEKEAPCRMLNIEFKFDKKNNPCPSMRDLYQSVDSFREFIQAGRSYIILKDPEEIYPSLKSLVLELDEKQQDHIMIQLLLAQILIAISRLEQEKLENQSPVSSIYVKKAINYIHQHYDQDIKISQLAELLNIHEGYLYRIFKEYMHVTPNEYLTRLRIEKAKMLLTRTDIPIVEISDYVGINSRQYFTYLFKKYTSITPSKYRSLALKGQIQKK